MLLIRSLLILGSSLVFYESEAMSSSPTSSGSPDEASSNSGDNSPVETAARERYVDL